MRRSISRLVGWSVGVLAFASLPSTTPLAAQQPATFWQGLGDTTLARLMTTAVQANRDVVMAQARVRQARASQLNAKLDLAPAITFAAGYSRQQVSNATFGTAVPNRSLWDAGLYASWELDVFGRLRKNLQGQNALTESSQEDVRDMGRIVSADLATAYYAFRGSQERLVVLQRNAENQRRTLQLTRSRLQAGRGTAFDVERAQSLLSTTLAFVPTLESQIAASQHRIGD